MSERLSLRTLIVEPRGLASLRVRTLVPLGAVAAALIVGAVFLTITGNSPGEVYAKMLDSSFGSARTISETLVASTPLILTGVAAAIAFKMLVWNIGAEGQLMFGAVVAAGVGIALGEGALTVVAVPILIIAGTAGGAAWAGIAAVPRVYLGTNEIITTLMLNFIALNLMNYLVFGSFSPWRDPNSAQFPQGRPLGDGASMPTIVESQRVDYGLLIAIGVAVFAWFLIGRTRWGFEVRIAGDSPDAARYAGINVPRKILAVFLMSGASAGLAGGLLVLGILGRLDPQALNVGLGFTGIIVAALARLNPLAVVPVAILIGGLNNAGPAMQSIGVPTATIQMLQGAILVFAVAGEFLIAHRIRAKRRAEAAA